MILLLVIDPDIKMVTSVNVAPDYHQLVAQCDKKTVDDCTAATETLFTLLMNGDRFEVSRDLGTVITDEEIEDLSVICWFFL